MSEGTDMMEIVNVHTKERAQNSDSENIQEICWKV